jgi:hypothetical protein
MATTSAALSLIETLDAPTSAPHRARRRLLSMADALGSYVTGRLQPPVLPPAPPGCDPEHAPQVSQLDRIAGPIGPGAYPAPVPPRPADKPSTVAHYQAMASQVAHERQVAALGRRLEATRPGGDLPREVWFVHPVRHGAGDLRYG